MTTLPNDLVAKIAQLHDDDTEQRFVCDSLEKLWDGGLNVGPAQLARAIVFLADGNLSRFRELRANFMGDPRDLLVRANASQQNSSYWFSEPFSKMGHSRNPTALKTTDNQCNTRAD